MMKLSLYLLLTLQLCLIAFPSQLHAKQLTLASPESLGFSAERLQRLTIISEDYVKNGQLAGGVILVARHGKLAYYHAFGQQDIESNTPMQKDSMFRLASQTKAIVSVAVMLLQERGELLLSDPLSKYLPEFKNTTVAVTNQQGGYDVIPSQQEITIHQLLTHTSGIGYGDGPAKNKWKQAGIDSWYFADKDEPIAKTVSRLATLPFDVQPGEQFIYGFNVDILGALIEKVSGQPLDEFLFNNIFKPLGMTDTYFYLPESKKQRLVTVYSAKADGSIVRAPQSGAIGQGEYVSGPRKSFSGGAGLVSTAMDYAQFLQMLLNGGIYNQQRLLSPKTVELMSLNHLGDIEYPWDNGVGFGLGFRVVTDVGAYGKPASVGEYGWGGAYHSVYWVNPSEDLFVIYLTQLIPSLGLDDEEKVRALVYQALID